LGRIWLEQLAPKEKIRACKWFEQNTDLREKDGVTRAQRAKYAVQGVKGGAKPGHWGGVKVGQ
jgi:hypothetical protein